MQVRDEHHVGIGVAAQVGSMRHAAKERGSGPKHRIGNDADPFNFDKHRRVPEERQMLRTYATSVSLRGQPTRT